LLPDVDNASRKRALLIYSAATLNANSEMTRIAVHRVFEVSGLDYCARRANELGSAFPTPVKD